MSTGYPPPVEPPVQFLPGSPPAPGWPSFTAPAYGPPPLTDHELQQLPPPDAAPRPASGPSDNQAASPTRPAVVTIAATMAVTASLQWVCALSLVWVTATVGADALGAQGDQGAIFHILNRFHYRMIEGLAWPLYGFGLLSLITGFLILSGRARHRIAHTVVGAAMIGWSAWWLRDNLAWWFSSAAYVAVACLILWTPAATRWFSRPRSSPGLDQRARIS